MKVIFVRLWFFDQWEFEKKSNSINRVLHHSTRRTSEHWCWENYFPSEQISLSVDKRWRRLNFLSSIDYFSGIFLAFPCDVLWCRARKSLNWSVHMKSNRFQRQFTLHMAIKCVDKLMFLCHREKTKKIHSEDSSVGSYSRIEPFSGLRNRQKVDFLNQNIFFKSLIFRRIRIREKIQFN